MTTIGTSACVSGSTPATATGLTRLRVSGVRGGWPAPSADSAVSGTPDPDRVHAVNPVRAAPVRRRGSARHNVDLAHETTMRSTRTSLNAALVDLTADGATKSTSRHTAEEPARQRTPRTPRQPPRRSQPHSRRIAEIERSQTGAHSPSGSSRLQNHREMRVIHMPYGEYRPRPGAPASSCTPRPPSLTATPSPAAVRRHPSRRTRTPEPQPQPQPLSRCAAEIERGRATAILGSAG